MPTRMVEDDYVPLAVEGYWPPRPSSPTPMQLYSDYTIDLLGRTTQTLGPAHTIDLGGTATSIRTATWTIYQDIIDQVWSGQGFQVVSSGAFTSVNPVSLEFMPTDALTRTSVKAVYSGTDWPPPADYSFLNNRPGSAGRSISSTSTRSRPPRGSIRRFPA